jgi:pyrroline-5-carboxylate reductase
MYCILIYQMSIPFC